MFIPELWMAHAASQEAAQEPSSKYEALSGTLQRLSVPGANTRVRCMLCFEEQNFPPPYEARLINTWAQSHPCDALECYTEPDESDSACSSTGDQTE